ncbi:MAG: aspartate aminotransferase family protein [Parvibaculaceae bacterium]
MADTSTGTKHTAAQQARDHLWMPYSSPGTQGAAQADIRFLVKGEGCRLWDSHGNQYLDGISALEAAILGHGDEEVLDAIRRQGQNLAFFDLFRFAAPVQAELASELTRLAPGMQYAVFAPGGAEADEIAIKIARQYHHLRGQPYRKKVLTRQGSFHGVTYGAMGLDGRYFASSNDVYDGGLSWGRTVGVHKPYPAYLGKAGRHVPSVDSIESVIIAEGPETVAAVVVDPMATAMAVGVPPDDYQRELRSVCDRHGVLLICDEVIAGMGRTGRLFATEHAGIQADFITISKGLSTGYFPIAACLVAPHVSDLFKEKKSVFRHGHTYSGHPMGAAAALAVLARLERDRLWERAEVLGNRLLSGLKGLSGNPLYWDARGRGLLAGLEFVADARTGEDFKDRAAVGNELRLRCHELGLITLILHPGNILFIAPPLTVTEAEIDEMVGIVGTALDDIARRHGKVR